MKGKAFALALLCALMLAAPAQAGLWAKIEMSPAVARQGQTVVVKAYMGEWENVKSPPYLGYGGETMPMTRGMGGWWLGVLGVDLDATAGSRHVEVLLQGKVVGRSFLQVLKQDYGTRQITVDNKYVEPQPEQLLRHQEDVEAQRQVYASRLTEMLWNGSWAKPMDSPVVGVFGRRSLVNGQARSPHGGVDLKGGIGAPIHSPAGGRVALVRDTFMSGLVVLIDHGLGIITGYRHLSQADVRQGQEVAKGQVIGLVGMSGRVTGPHLHFDLKVAGARVDPLAWIEQSKEMAQGMGKE